MESAKSYKEPQGWFPRWDDQRLWFPSCCCGRHSAAATWLLHCRLPQMIPCPSCLAGPFPLPKTTRAFAGFLNWQISLYQDVTMPQVLWILSFDSEKSKTISATKGARDLLRGEWKPGIHWCTCCYNVIDIMTFNRWFWKNSLWWQGKAMTAVGMGRRKMAASWVGKSNNSCPRGSHYSDLSPNSIAKLVWERAETRQGNPWRGTHVLWCCEEARQQPISQRH